MAAATLEGCNAGGTAACRFCGFGSYEPCPVVVTQELVLSGTIDDFDAAEFAAAFAAYLDLPPTAQVRLAVTPASISVSAFILFPDEAQMQSSGVLEKLEVLETNGAAEASVELGVVIESIPSPAVASTAAQSNKLDSSAGLSSEGGTSVDPSPSDSRSQTQVARNLSPTSTPHKPLSIYFCDCFDCAVHLDGFCWYALAQNAP